MSNRIVELNINFEKNIASNLRFKQFDTTELHCYFNGNVDLKNKIISLIFMTSDKLIIQQEAKEVDTNKNIGIFLLDKSCLRNSGKVEIEIELKENDETISTFKTSGNVEVSNKKNITADNTSNYLETIEKAIKEYKLNEEERQKLYNEIKQEYENGDLKGEQGNPGTNGYTPIKGTDYFTAEEINSIKIDIKNDLSQNILGNIDAILDSLNGEVV